MATRRPKIAGARFSEKNVLFLKLIGPVIPLWVLYPSKIMRVGFLEPSLARAMFTGSIRVLGWQPGSPKPREHDFLKKTSYFFEIHRTSDTSMGSVSL